MPNNPNATKNLKSYKPGTTGNMFGRPKKLLSRTMHELRQLGYEHIKPVNVEEAYEILLGLSANQVRDIAEDKTQPAILYVAARNLLTRHGADMLEKMLNRVHGKPLERMAVETQVKREIDPKKKARVMQLI